MSAANSTKTATKTARGRPFKAGQSGNPSGRPKIPEDVKEAIRAACPKAVSVLVSMLNSKKEAYRLEAAKTLLDRGYGKPVQMQDVSLDLTGTLDVVAQVRRVAMELDNDRCRD